MKLTKPRTARMGVALQLISGCSADRRGATSSMTPDGIATEDWDRIHELALEVVNDSAEGDEAASDAASVRLRELLDQLQEKYGALPSLLATRADYVASPEERE